MESRGNSFARCRRTCRLRSESDSCGEGCSSGVDVMGGACPRPGHPAGEWGRWAANIRCVGGRF